MKNLKKVSLCLLLVLSLMLGFVSCFSGSPSGGDSPDPSEEGSPNGSGDIVRTEPYINVFTEFPSGEIMKAGIDITYEAYPSDGYEITRVYHTVNGDKGNLRDMYRSGSNGWGELGKGSIMLRQGENNIVFTVVDSAGKEAHYVVDNTVLVDVGHIPPSSEKYIKTVKNDFEYYAADRIIIYLKKDVSYDEIEQIATEIDGKIIGYLTLHNKFYIEIPDKTEDELEALRDTLLLKHEDLIEKVFLQWTVFGITGNLSYTNDPWWNESVTVKRDENGNMVNPGMVDDTNNSSLPQQWGLTAINAPGAWNKLIEYNNTKKVDVKVGVVDGLFKESHEDLALFNSGGTIISAPWIYNYTSLDADSLSADHGTHVMGTIGAVHDNGVGIAGVADIERESLYGYGIGFGHDLDRIFNEVYRAISIDEVQVINVSMGLHKPQIPGHDFDYSNYTQLADLEALCDESQFIIVNAAGNGYQNQNSLYLYWPDPIKHHYGLPFDAKNNGIFCGISKADGKNLFDRIIVVGAIRQNTGGNVANQGKYEICYFSNYGDRVDVVAPGYNIYSSVSNTNTYELLDGTSMAAPHVTGVVAMMWAANPDLPAEEIKGLLIESASENIWDYRRPISWPERDYPLVNAAAAVEMAYNWDKEETGSISGTVSFYNPFTDNGDPAANIHKEAPHK